MATTSSATVTEDCAVFFGHHGPLIASGDKIGLHTKIKAQLRSVQAWDCDTWIGLTLDFPLGKDQKANEEAGFGVRYRAPEHGSQDKSKLCEYHQIRIKFPSNFSHEVQLGQSPSTFTNEHLIYVKIHFGEDRATIEGFGIPFANHEDHQVESWINGDAPIAGKYGLLEILQQQSLYLVLPASSSLVQILGTTQNLSTFRYPYSEDLSWDLACLEKELRENKGQQFAPLYSHPTDVSHMTAVSQSIVQDVVWLRHVAKRLGYTYSKNRYGLDISSKEPARMPAYFFWCKAPDTDTEGKECLHLAIPFSEPLVKAIGPAWKLLIQRRIFRLEIFTSREGRERALADWFCRLAPLGKLDRYARHRKDTTDMILVVRPKIKMDDYHDVIWRGEPPRKKSLHIDHSRNPFFDKLKTFKDRQSASEARLLDEKSSNYISLGFHFEFNQCQHQVEAALLFHPQAHPYNPIACGLPTKLVSGVVKTDTLLDEMSEEQQQLFDEVKDRMDLHRSVLRGAGFYDWMTKTDGNSKRRPLPTIDLLDIDDETYANAILEMALPKDRARFRSYLSNRPLGIGIITGDPERPHWALQQHWLYRQSSAQFFAQRQPIQLSTTSHIISTSKWDVTERLNAGKSLDDSNRYRRKLVIRLYSPNEEMNAFYILFTRPELGKEVLDSWKVPGELNEDVNWKFHLSAAYWLLLLFESPAVDRRLGPDDSLALHELKKVIDEDRECGAIRYGHAQHVSESLNDIFTELLDMFLEEADLLCTTPRPCGSNEFMRWQRRLARGVVVDQAGRMNRPDLYRVWGNTLLPCFLIGDTRSEQPIIQTTSEKEPGTENYYNRFAGDGQLSGLEFLQASGLPSFRLDTQVRMAKGMYDLAAQVFYPQLPLQYHQSDHEIADQQPDVGQELEAYARMKYPNLRKPPGGIVHQPLFIHRQNSTIYKDVDGSQACQEQGSAVLSFVAGLVTRSVIDPAQIVILTPWFANAVLIERKRNQKRFELLKNMPEAATIESYRGRESDIVVVVMSTTRDTGPDITVNEHLLITMLTRHKSGLVIFGDICTSGVIGEDRNGKLFKINKPGQELNALQRIDETLFDRGRVAVFSTKLGK
ncbi:DNA helicase [Fusarium napiforme]|uniref:DNA helicase n=1 Tax=Fusarium napiforme TaxID=42672 RepID=A0A8H5K5S6_9HYPO|nr:DNA helicase [Fusarium napiforme]